MQLITQISCGNCGKSHRIHRPLRRGTRYRFTCKRCRSTVTFSTSSVRWAYRPRDLPLDQTFSGSSTITRDPGDGPRQAPRAPVPPPVPLDARRPARTVRDTMMDERAPIHLTPLVRRGVAMERESSRVRWLRDRIGYAAG